MGESRKKRYRFLEENPLCCFCGGKERATTIDHQPGRLFFSDRKHPDGFEFPSCVKCNNITSTDEQLVRIFVTRGEMSEKDHAKWFANLSHVRSKKPDLIERMMLSHRDIRNILRERSIKIPPGAFIKDVPMIRLYVDDWESHIERVGRKIALGLHYQIFKQPLPDHGRIYMSFHTNIDKPNEFWDSFRDLCPNLVTPEYQGTDISDQFSLRFGCNLEHGTGAWLFHLHSRLLFLTLTVSSRDWIERFEGSPLDRELTHFGIG